MIAVSALILEHFVGIATIAKSGGYKKAAAIIENSVPTNKRTRSGDLGEILACEYVDSQTSFRVPVRKLIWKSDRQMPMHGNDIVAVDATSKPCRVLKGESKSRAAFGSAAVDEAVETLDLHAGRPNPSTLAFITKRLYEQNRDSEAQVFEKMQCKGALTPRQIDHLIFALAGTDPTAHLTRAPKPKRRGISRSTAAIFVKDHPAFLASVYK